MEKIIQIGRYAESLASLDKALTIHPNNAMTWNVSGLALSKLNRHAEALASFDKAIAIDPNYSVAWNSRGIALDKLGRHSEAVDSFDKEKSLKSLNSKKGFQH